MQKIRYSPNPQWSNPSAILDGAKFEVSDDNVAWTTLFTLKSADIKTGWSNWVAESV